MIVKSIFENFKDSLKPEPGRYALTWRIALLCALMAGFAMLYQIPESAISCYLIIFLMKPDATLNMGMSVALALIICFIVVLLFVLTDLTVNSGLLKMIAIFFCSYIAVFLGALFKSELGNLIALILAFLLSVIGYAPTGEIATRALLYATLMAVSPLFLMFLFNLFFGKRSQTLILEKLQNRLQQTMLFLNSPQTEIADWSEFVDKSSQDCAVHLKLIKVLHLMPEIQSVWLENAVHQSFKMMALIAVSGTSITKEAKQAILENCERLKRDLKSPNFEKNHFEALIQPNSDNLSMLEQFILRTQIAMLQTPSLPPQPKISLKEKWRHFQQTRAQKKQQKAAAKKALPPTKINTAPSHYFAIKVTLAALTCYCIYNIFDWVGIHTAMITCYVVALSTTAETVHKLILRISGCLLGALMGVISIVYILPHLDEVGGLMVLVFFCMLIPAWITAGSQLFSYAGVQIGLAFLLTTVHGFSPTVDLSIAQDRILGILLGNVVSYFFFTFLWPVSISVQIEKQFNQWLAAQLSDLNLQSESALTIIEAEQLRQQTTEINESLKLTLFEQDNVKLDAEDHKNLRAILAHFNRINAFCLLPISSALIEDYKMALARYLVLKPQLELKPAISQLLQFATHYDRLFHHELGKNNDE